MSKETNDVNLIETLRLALGQCEQKERLLEDRTQTISRLQAQVNSLQNELSAVQNNELIDKLSKQSGQIESLLKDNAEKQFEIDRLRRTLQTLKTKVRSRGVEGLLSSSPILASAPGGSTENYVSPASTVSRLALGEVDDSSDPGSTSYAAEEASGASPVRKRLRTSESSSPHVPTATAGQNKLLGTRMLGSSGSKYTRQIPKEEAIEAIAEDGEQVRTWRKHKAGDQIETARPPAHDRLSELMAQPLSAAFPLSRVSAVQTRPEVLGESRKNGAKPDQKLATETHFHVQPVTSSISASDSKSHQPLRSRPVHELHLTHFKLNPAFIDHPDVANSKHQRGRSTYSRLIDQGKEEDNDEILMKFLGPGSDERIRTLTASARRNLLHEARTNLMSDVYGNKHMQFTREHSPSGFWSTDMAGSQEEKIHRGKGMLKEDDEVRQRYHVAIKGGGRWIFADE